MNFIEKHELIQKTIKDNCDKKLKDIEVLLEKAFATNGRQITEAFSFYSGASLSAYLKQERNKKIYLYSQEQNCSMEEAAAAFGSDLPTFSKSFKRDFGKSPSQMSKEEFDNLPDEFSINSILGEKDMLPMEENMECVFGIPKDKYKQLMEVLKYSSAYGFSQKKAQQAYEISEKMNVAISDAFEFVDQFERGEIEEDDSSETEMCAFLYFNYDISLPRAWEETRKMEASGVDNLFEEPREVIDAFIANIDGCHEFVFYKGLYEKLKERGEEELFEFYCKECLFGDTPEECLEINDSIDKYDEEMNNKSFSEICEEYNKSKVLDDEFFEIEESFHKGTWENPDDEENVQDIYDYLCYSD